MSRRKRVTATKILTVFLLLAAGFAPLAIAGSPRLGQVDKAQIARLAGLGKLWGYIKFTHPWMAFKTKEWDQALVAAIPKVKAAASAEEYGQAIDHMLSFLKDPATRRVTGNSQPGNVGSSTAPASDRKQPYIDWPDPETAVITATDYAAIDSSPFEYADTHRFMTELSKAKSIIFDIRRARDAKNVGRIGFTVNSMITTLLPYLIKESVPLPLTRFVYHQGYAPQTRSDNLYYSALATSAGGELRSANVSAWRPAQMVFILNAGSTNLYKVLRGLQDQGAASVVQEGDKNPDAGVTVIDPRSMIALPDGIILQIRQSELVGANGSASFSPNVEVAAPTNGQADPAKQAALELSKKAPIALTHAGGNAQQAAQKISFSDDPYPQMTYPTEEYRLLALFRFWNAIQYFYPYKELMDQPWARALYDFIPKMQQARDATEYALTVAELVTRIQDSHGRIDSNVFSKYMGVWPPPLQVEVVEGQIVVTRIDESAKPSVDLRVGDVVLAVDNEDITKRRERLAKYLPVSTPGRLNYMMARQVLLGPQNSEILLKVRTRQGETKEVKLTRSGARTTPPSKELPVYRMLPEGYGYVDFERLTSNQALAAYETVKNTPGLIIDMRTYASSGALPFALAMAKKGGLPQLQISQIQYDGMRGLFVKTNNPQYLFPRPAANPYQGKVVVLISPATQSFSESICLDLESIGLDVTFIGAPTSGADGNVTDAVLPGGISVIFTGAELKHGDGRQLQRLGVQPNIEVRPTIEGIVQGRDEVMERAIKFLKGEPAKSQ